LNTACSNKIENQHRFKRLVKCQKTWVYFKLDHQIHGKVLSYAKGECGYFAIPSNVIVRTSSGDTIRAMELPCLSEVFEKSDSILVMPISKVDSLGGGLGDGKYDCKVKQTCFAHLSKIK
jgi:hypothetical protein